MFTKSDWLEITELTQLLGYTDERSVVKWCKNQAIPVVKMGLKKYISSQLLTQCIDNQLLTFVKPKSKPSSSESKYKPDNKTISNYLEKYEAIKPTSTSKKRSA